MIEQKLEKNVIDKLTSILTNNGISNFRVYGSLQPDIMKGVEDISNIVVVVKAYPRSYQSPTIPTCQIDFEVQLTLRADIDYSGKNYLDVCDMLMTQFEEWQKCLDSAHYDFSLPEFQMVGFQLGSGTNAADPDKVVWQYKHNFTVYGVVQ